MGKLSDIADWVERLPEQGRYVFTRQEAEGFSNASRVAVQHALRRMKERGRIVAPRRGFYVLVPAEYRVAGCPPASWFIDDLMRHLGRRYYVALLSAAALHGAAHQQPMVFQVVVDRPVRDMKAGRVKIETHRKRAMDDIATSEVQTETGTMVVATPETTAFDLIHFPAAAGFWDNVATVLAELTERLSPDRLLQAAKRAMLSDVQRLGYLLDLVSQDRLADPLAGWLGKRRTTVVRLRSDKPAGDHGLVSRWRLIPNEHVEPDL